MYNTKRISFNFCGAKCYRMAIGCLIGMNLGTIVT